MSNTTAITNNEPTVATADSPVNSATLKTPVVLGIDIGGTNLRVGLVDALGALVDSRRVSSQEALSGDDPMTKLADYLEGYLSEVLDGKYELKAISVGFPSVVDATRTVVLQTTFIPGLNNVNVPQRLSRFGVPRVHRPRCEHDYSPRCEASEPPASRGRDLRLLRGHRHRLRACRRRQGSWSVCTAWPASSATSTRPPA